MGVGLQKGRESSPVDYLFKDRESGVGGSGRGVGRRGVGVWGVGVGRMQEGSKNIYFKWEVMKFMKKVVVLAGR